MRSRLYITMIIAAAALLSGCSRMEELRMASPDGIRPPHINSVTPGNIAVTNSKLDDVVTFAWDAADFGVRTPVSYNLEAEYGESGVIEVFPGISGTSLEISYEELNYVLGLDTQLGGAGVPLDTPSNVNFYVCAYIGDGTQTSRSEPVELNVTVIYAKPRYPNVWVIGKYSNWEHSRSQYLYSFGNDGVYEGLVDFGENADTDNYGDASDCGFKLTGAANWSNSTGNWGMTRAITDEDYETDEIQLGNGGGNINKVFQKRYYQLRYTVNSLLLEKLLSFDGMSISGTAVTEEPELLFDTANQRFYFDVDAGEGGTIVLTLKDAVRQGGGTDGDIALGASEEASAEPGKGFLSLGSDKPLTVPAAGSYRVYVEMNNPEEMTYEFNADDFGKEPGKDDEDIVPVGETWGIVGTMTDWGGEDDENTEEDESIPDIPMTETGDWFKATVGLTAEDAFKIRFANTWNDDNTDNFGGADGNVIVTQSEGVAVPAVKVLNEGSPNNISVSTGGTYDLYFNPELGALHVRPEGSPAPGDVTWGITGIDGDWLPGNDLLMEEVDGTDYYVLTGLELTGVNDASGEASSFKIRYGNWWNQNSDNGRGLPAGTQQPVSEGRTVSLSTDGGSANITVAETGTYNVYFYPNQNAMMVRNTDGDVPATVGWGLCGYFTGWEDNNDAVMTYEDGYNVIRGISIPEYDPASGLEDGFIIRYGNTSGGREFGMPSDADACIDRLNTAVRLSSDASARNITATSGTYDIYFDADHGIIYMNEKDAPAPSPYSVGVWAENLTAGIPDVPMKLEGDFHVWYQAVFPQDDRIRIRISDNDGIAYGAAASVAGINVAIPVVTGDAALPVEVPAGSYQIWFDMNASELYIMTDGRHPGDAGDQGSVPGLCGTFTKWGQDGDPDIAMTRRQSGGRSYWVAEDVTLSDSDRFKIRYDNKWEREFGYLENTVLPVNGKVEVYNPDDHDMFAPAGTYDIWLYVEGDSTVAELYLINDGRTPEEL